ncbi:hypothetical protein KC343_g287 [Hortaea werneckii]|nr:hypothetical protein KC352_g4697 [Hortaea werneckii]KAI7573006.1 hypothetical protein KC317_g261 [Hortaea werneckii]KAI7627878.1 hypothetical protein KC346_g509 [Hortaea werneckii]KAI7638133.1 hypothetical protein KC343_g287 [Hortaea werneckii]KAI7683597.1 hypothetical protein KC319_g396 [Hortaea werneckii]
MTASPLHPKWDMVKERELFGRQADTYQTCAYRDGDANSPLTCDSGSNCGWFTNTPYLACCTTDDYGSFGSDCQPVTTCLGYWSNDLSSTETYAVTSDNSYLCPSALPACGTAYVYGTDYDDTETYSYYVCNTASFTYDNIYGYALTTGSAITASATTDAFTSISLPPSSVSIASGSGQSPSSEDDDTSPPTGAIVGGVVGGVAALALIAGFIAYRVIKNRKERKPSIPEISQYSDSTHAR